MFLSVCYNFLYMLDKTIANSIEIQLIPGFICPLEAITKTEPTIVIMTKKIHKININFFILFSKYWWITFFTWF